MHNFRQWKATVRSRKYWAYMGLNFLAITLPMLIMCVFMVNGIMAEVSGQMDLQSANQAFVDQLHTKVAARVFTATIVITFIQFTALYFWQRFGPSWNLPVAYNEVNVPRSDQCD